MFIYLQQEVSQQLRGGFPFMRGNFQGKEKGKETGNKEEKGGKGTKCQTMWLFIHLLRLFLSLLLRVLPRVRLHSHTASPTYFRISWVPLR